jgi:hypothetical protein
MPENQPPQTHFALLANATADAAAEGDETYEPTTYAKAIASTAADQWQKAMTEEENALEQNYTWDWEIKKMDAVTTLPYFTVEEEYVRQPTCREQNKTEDKVCKQTEALDHLKQAPQVWFHSTHQVPIKQNSQCCANSRASNSS